MGYLDAAKTFGSLKGNRVTLENDPTFDDYCQRYYRGFLNNNPHDFLTVLKVQEKNAILHFKDRIEESFILALEELMDMYGISFRETYKTADLIALIKEKAKQNPANREEKSLQEYIAGKKTPRAFAKKGLWYSALLLKD